MRFVVFSILAVLAPATWAQCDVAPTAANDSAVHLGSRVLVDVLANDSDVDGQALSPQLTGGTCPGAADLDRGGLLGWTAPGHVPSCTITYRVYDDDGLSDTATVTLGTSAIFYDNFESESFVSWTATVGE